MNAHTHLDLTAAESLFQPDRDFIAWIENIIRFRAAPAPERDDHAVLRGYGLLRDSGASLVADISTRPYPFEVGANGPEPRPFFEVLGLARERREAFWAEFQRALGGANPTRKLGLSPHAPYSTARTLYEAAGAAGVPVTTHLGEFREEAELLDTRSGPFRELLRNLGAWLPGELAPGWEWILDALPRGSLIAHANYLPAETLKRGGHSVVYCPRTHAAFGHAPHPFREFLDAGVNVCLGTDSLASNPDLDVFAEAVFLHRKYPDFPAERLLGMATVNGSIALGENVGEWLSAAGDWLVIPLAGDGDSRNPYRALFQSESGAGTVRHRLSEVWRLGSGQIPESAGKTS